MGQGLAEALHQLMGELAISRPRPAALARLLDIPGDSASRTLKLLATTDPGEALLKAPGPAPLRKLIEAAARAGASEHARGRAMEAVDEFEALIKNEVAGRGGLEALVTSWRPDDEGAFASARRQVVYRAMSELEGVSCDLELSAILLLPASGSLRGDEDARLDLVSVTGLIGLDRIRPDAPVCIGTRRLTTTGDPARPRVPLTLDGDPAVDGLRSAQIEGFTSTPPGSLEAKISGSSVHYMLGPTCVGRDGKVDVVIAEVNRAEIAWLAPSDERPPQFYSCQELPAKRSVFDLLVHRDVYPDAVPTVHTFLRAVKPPAVVRGTVSELDARPFQGEFEVLRPEVDHLSPVEFPRYAALLRHAADKLRLSLGEFRMFRAVTQYPLIGSQTSLAFLGSAPGRP